MVENKFIVSISIAVFLEDWKPTKSRVHVVISDFTLLHVVAWTLCTLICTTKNLTIVRCFPALFDISNNVTVRLICNAISAVGCLTTFLMSFFKLQILVL